MQGKRYFTHRSKKWVISHFLCIFKFCHFPVAKKLSLAWYITTCIATTCVWSIIKFIQQKLDKGLCQADPKQGDIIQQTNVCESGHGIIPH
jgi:hypothetical protein